MSQELSPRRPRLGSGFFDLDRAAGWAHALLRATSGRGWSIAAAGTLVIGGAAAGLHAPTSGAWFWHVANGELISRHGLSGTALSLARPGAVLDLRSWLADLGLFLIYRSTGLVGLAVTGAVAGALIGGCLILAIRATARSHPLVALLAGGLGLGALAPVITDLSSELLAVLAALLVLTLTFAGRRSWWGAGAAVALIVVWTNSQADAGIAVVVIWGWVVLGHWDANRPGRPTAPSWWVIPLAGVALILSPRGIGAVAQLPLSLGMQGENPLLAAWSSINFHPWTARVAELAGMVLLVAYWLAGSRLRRTDALLGLGTGVLALLWANYLPWFLVVAAVQSSWYLSVAWLPRGAVDGLAPTSSQRGGAGSHRAAVAAAIPILIAILVLGSGLAAVSRRGGVSGQTKAQLPVQAARWLAVHPARGAWFTTPSFGDYLSSRFPSGHNLLCIDDPVPMAGAALGQCEALAELNAGSLAILRSLGAKLAVLPRAAPAAAFLRAEGWEIRYRDPTTVVLAPRNL
ncbi:MAG: hypothetical protein WCB86_10540 [Candidatus Dormiibacterota bacterium]